MGFELCLPAVNLIYFVSVLYGMLCFRHPVFLIISFLNAVAYSIKRNGMKAVVFDAVLLLLTGAFALYYSTYNHFGVTVIEQKRYSRSYTVLKNIIKFYCKRRLGAVSYERYPD